MSAGSLAQLAPKPDVSTIRRALSLLADGLIEIRVLDGHRVSAGYFDSGHYDQAAEVAAKYARNANVYFTPNPPVKALLARAANRVVEFAKITTSDRDIASLRWLLIDLDPVRPAGVSSTDAEHQAALDRAGQVAAYLTGERWGAGILADSGGGAHINFRIDLPNTDASRDLLKTVLTALDRRFSDDIVRVDVSTYNAARIWRLYGTPNRKGDSTPERPHRLSKLLSEVETPQIVSRELLEKLASQAPQAQCIAANFSSSASRFDLKAWLKRRDVPVGPSIPWNGGEKFLFPICPFDATHINSVGIFRFATGAVDFRCLHNSCAGNDWHKFRRLYEPESERTRGRRASSDSLAEQSRRTGQATQLLEELESRVELFHDAGTPYASFNVGTHRETHALNSRSFRQYAAAVYYDARKSVPSGENLASAINVLAARASAEKNRPVYLRSGRIDKKTAFLDVGDAEWNVIRIDRDGWSIISSNACPIRFRRSKSTLPLIMPVRGGDIRELRSFVNLDPTDPHAFILLVCFIVAILLGVAPYPILLLIAESGAAKSTLMRILRKLLDPSSLEVRAFPKEPRDFAVACQNSLLILFDNVSSLPAWLSDLMCVASTGGGFGVRKLHSDDEEQIFQYRRPQAISTIKEIAYAADFLSRALTLRLVEIKRRETEENFWGIWEIAAPRIFGSLLDGAVYALAHPIEHEIELPLLADFALAACAAAPAFDWSADDLLAAYAANSAALSSDILEFSPIADYLPVPFVGTATELLAFLNSYESTVPEQVRKSKRWPSDPRALSNELRIIVPNLRASRAIEIAFEKPKHSKRLIRITRIEKSRD